MLSSIQACRGIAALMVVLLHTSTIVAQPHYFGHKPVGTVFDFGHAGVDFFFVLSGFIIFHVHGRDIGHPSRFVPYVIRRLLRLYPVYWALYLGFSCAAWLIEPSVLPADIEIFLKGMFLIPQDKALIGGSGAPVIVVAWTLHHELLFYAAFGAFVVSLPLGCLFLGCWLLAGMLFSSFPGTLLGSLHNTEFLMGVGCAWYVARKPTAHGVSVAIFGAIGFFGTGAFEVSGNLESEAIRILGYGASSAAVVFGLASVESRASMNVCAPLRFLGDASYSIYLVHYPALGVLCRLILREEVMRALPAPVLYWLLMALAVAAGCLVYWILERPLLALGCRWFVRQISAG